MQAALVAAGIFLSRILGLVREALKARYLGATDGIVADAFNAAFRIPNLLQNLFGEGALSASFIPVYANLLAKGDKREAARVAGAIGAFLALVTATLVLAGVTGAPLLVDIVARGFEGERRELTITLIRILFPGAALFVFSAWCLGILNSHRRFFVSYAAPVAWNAAMISTLYAFRGADPGVMVVRLAWASVIGAGLQFLVQVPVVLRVAPEVRLSLGRGSAAVREVVTNFVPAFFARGVAQINGFVDQLISSYLPLGSVSLLFYAQTITLLPISLFGMAISAAELPEMSSATEDARSHEHVRARLAGGLGRMAFFVVPSAVAFILLGDVIAAVLYQHGRFTADDTRFTWGILAAAGVGLLASAMGRLYSSAFYALRDTRTPLRFAIVRLALAAGAGWFVATRGPALVGIDVRWGAAALTLSSAIAGWVEFTLLRSRLRARVNASGLDAKLLVTLWVVAGASGTLAFGVKTMLADANRFLLGAATLGTFGALYLGATAVAGVDTARVLLRRARLIA